MKVYLTGGTGFIGQPLTKALLARGWSVTALVRKPDSPQAQALSKMGVQLAKGDVLERETMRTAMSGAEIVVHNAGMFEYGLDRAGNQRMHAVNVDGTENVLGLAHELGIRRTVYVSTIQAFGGSGPQMRDETYTRQVPIRTSYEQSKTDAHQVALGYQQRGLPLITVCPHQVIGANDHSPLGYFMRLYVNRLMPPMAWSPTSTFCCVELHDLAEGIALAAEKGRSGETYFLCGDPQSFREIFACWRKRSGAFLPRIWLPTGLAAAFFAPLEPLQRKLGLHSFLSAEIVRVSAMNWIYSSEKAQRELGWTHCSAEAMWLDTYDGEVQLLSKRKNQNLLQRLKPLDVAE